MIEKGINQAKGFGAEIVDEEVVGIKRKEGKFVVSTGINDYENLLILRERR